MVILQTAENARLSGVAERTMVSGIFQNVEPESKPVRARTMTHESLELMLDKKLINGNKMKEPAKRNRKEECKRPP